MDVLAEGPGTLLFYRELVKAFLALGVFGNSLKGALGLEVFFGRGKHSL